MPKNSQIDYRQRVIGNWTACHPVGMMMCIKRKEYNKYFLMEITLNGPDDKRYWRYINLAAVRFLHDYNSLSAVGFGSTKKIKATMPREVTITPTTRGSGVENEADM
ncbi:hypothetical protein Agabi119p4_5618 [Agaricus bisporus var. burnettii]|uniref:Uncharacterized protein n=1 Tax=Agaricus bisporus var. burnettii TaxID=192524 RepID=A0A8H7F249_AGABI|nr:hypothetical protein Agabi119p4_5618 [Agaricus bisporus var. burnettii]